MPTANPRLSITLKPSLASVLRELSELAGNSQSAIVAELLETSQPVFEKMVLVMRAAATVRDAAKQDMVSGLERAQVRLEQQLGLISAEFETFSLPVLEAAERIDRRAGRGSAAPRADASGTVSEACKTPLSNRGVRSLTPTTKKPAATRT